MINIFPIRFPCELNNPKRTLIKNLREYLNYINRNAPYSNIYQSVYGFKTLIDGWKLDYNSAIIDKIFFDFDPHIEWTEDNVEERPDNGFYDFTMVIEYCKEHNLKYYPILSGNGYHVYVMAECKEDIKDKKALIYNAQAGLIADINEKIGEEHFGVWRTETKEVVSKFHVREVAELKAKNLGDSFSIVDLTIKTDPRTMGKVDQMARIPYTYNFKCRRYCIPIFPDLMNTKDTTIKRMAGDLNYVKEIKKKKFDGYGEMIWDISRFNTGSYKQVDNMPISFNMDVKVEGLTIEPPACIKHLLSQSSLGWDLRRVEILWFRDNGYLLNETLHILKSHLTKKRKHGFRMQTDFEHMISASDGQQPLEMYKRESLFFPTWETMKRMGLCPFKDVSECALNKKGCMLYQRENIKRKVSGL